MTWSQAFNPTKSLRQCTEKAKLCSDLTCKITTKEEIQRIDVSQVIIVFNKIVDYLQNIDWT
ncbi:hypothetical protein COY25_03255 [Candidatus Uhrbacteria bacterium CG_4_10_14_0_2_um_filter_41_7]|uniref:Uncharacterized protein n=1 Tax=Candidatus Uhrbacteria bacterium CG_4_9_14_3_um_filter_41_35 TaxID=1975034 RepID=A0A2M7XGS4_9BACT|nr:MAG: hypothetical protein COV92_00575 [Candidatus Uhrbacteria bacterium CG11_big_fil_rev_8_21_14_0_20_41_9]PIZ53610.1 MAG: hypothetical protein COY25_03255 [Candidatus Uhrbacteria bacterium CG_4_10_14_0_2_um_filter_41_7]PJA47073.1 MAG: hypothetical protein CO173_00210 [Candidatus Uhrbacteria bacterium CG_4_9_14_3_um_filter_41_35]